MDLPYRAEYAKSNRSSCKGCKSSIGQGTLRLAVMVQSHHFDGKQPNWYHFHCFFTKQRPKTVDDINHYESLRLEDQEKIKQKIDSSGSSTSVIAPPAKGKGKKRNASETAAKKNALKDYKIEYAKSGRAACRGCEQKILKDEIRISKKDFETEIGMKYGGQDMWHHVTCFAKLRSELGFFESGEVLPGFKTLKKEDQQNVKKEIPAIKQEDTPETKKVKKEDSEEDQKLDKLYKEQNKTLYKHRDALEKNLKKQQWDDLLEYNNQQIPPGNDKKLDRLADIMTFGALLPCEKCKDGQLVFNKLGYICQGDLTEWTKCQAITKTPKRVPFKVPKELAEEFPFLKKYKPVVQERALKTVAPTNGIKKEEDEVDSKPKVERALPPLYEMPFVILGKPKRGKDQLKKDIVKLGGKVVTKIDGSVMAVFASEEEVEKLGSRMQEAKSESVHVVPESFVDEAKNHAGKIPDLIISKSICDWGTDPTPRLPSEPSGSGSKSRLKSKSMYVSNKPSKIKLKVKGGGAVDPDSGLEHIAHVYQSGKDKYTAVLGLTDIQQNKNSFYKIQLLQADSGSRFWVFRAWGRIGTTIGGNKVEEMSSLIEAKKHFCLLYEEKSGNMWEDRHHFVKIPGRFYPVDVECGDEEQIKSIDLTDASSSLHPSVTDLIRLIFDVKRMKDTMLEFELDTEKMPLGKLSKKQIYDAYGVLNEINTLIEGNEDNARFIDASNRFYTLVPHSFGIADPPILKTKEMVEQKTQMLDNLMELEIAYNLLQSGGSGCSLDDHYKKLNTEIHVMDRNCSEFHLIHEYVRNTHAKTHSSYELDVQEVFVIKRQGEDKRYKPFRKMHNRKLLWHGSRVTNFAGILSQGLRIAPPEAPCTGYMFGKGIYFADMVSKSANYCCTNPSSPTGLLLLCEVALGNMYERPTAEYVTKLPPGKHSTKGIGKTAPDPSAAKTLEDGVEVPLGKPVDVPVEGQSHLLYNEYIVYDVAQVQVKYLLKVDFKYKY